MRVMVTWNDSSDLPRAWGIGPDHQTAAGVAHRQLEAYLTDHPNRRGENFHATSHQLTELESAEDILSTVKATVTPIMFTQAEIEVLLSLDLPALTKAKLREARAALVWPEDEAELANPHRVQR